MNNDHLWHLFASTVNKCPNEMALIAYDKQLTYNDLQQEVFYYINHLRSKGVIAGDRVAIYLPRDSRLIVALLAVIATGACYVPMDSRNPKQRNQTILSDSECKFIIAEDQIDENITQILPPDGKKIYSIPQEINRDQNQLAYIIYTSGSTGKPKGVMINHANACSMIHWALTTFSSTELAYTLAATSICFDLSIFEIFVPLSAGACIVLVDHALSLLDQNNLPPITLINTVPSAIHALNKAHAIPKSVKIINLAGEALQQSIVNELYENTTVHRVYNLYGPSETTTYSTYYLAQQNHTRMMVPIGKAIAGTQIYLLDQHQQPVPKLARGEIYIAGAGVSQGYINRLQETKAVFIELYINGRTIKLYRTGDLARLNHEGELEYLGRKDHQIKIRGFRVEPDEISHTIKKYHNITQAYVMTHPDVDAGEQLIAYLVTDKKGNVDITLLKEWLSKQLPDYMLPHYMLEIDTLPINSNGKIDRSALPLPGKNEILVSEYQTETERKLAEIWQSLLDKNTFDRNDNFFYVGGHSLLAARLQAKIQEIFKIQIKLEEIFVSPSIYEQAKLISERERAKSGSPIHFHMTARPNEIPLSYSQQRLWYLHHAEESTPISNIPIIITIQDGELDVYALTASLRHIINRHEILRTTYQSINYQVVQIIHDKFDFNIATIECDEESLPEWLNKEANKKFDLSLDLMIRASFFKTPNQSVLMITQHHIASDAWSLNILMRELSTYYSAYHRSLPIPVLPAPTQYADYSCWQRLHMNDNALSTDVDYWKHKLENAPDIINLPYDMPKPEIQTYKGEFYQFEIDDELFSKLKDISNLNKSTLFMTLLAGFNILLHRYTQQNDFCIGFLTANRSFSNLENTLGFFVNTLTLRSRIDTTITIREFFSQVKSHVLECLSHQQLPFDKVVEILHPNRQSNRHPFFQVLFSLQNALENNLELDGLQIETSEYDRKISKFDLTLSLIEKKHSLSALFEFNTDLFFRDTIVRLAKHYKQLLASLTHDLDKKLSDIDLLTQEDRKKWLIDLNAVNVSLPVLSISTCFQQSVDQFPDKTAVISDDKHYSYSEIDLKSSQLANLLREYGISKGSNVGLLLPRSIENIISMIAVIKAGGCYVPMDTNWPTDRLDYILQDANINLIISLQAYTDQLPVSSHFYTIMFDEMETIIAQQSSDSFIINEATDSCYIIYTSGSTGKPKGVVAQHQGVVRLVKNPNYVNLDENQRLLQISQLVFDAATFDIWGSLLNGSTLVLMPDGLPELNKLSELIVSHNITTLFVTTQLFNTLVDYKLSSLFPLKQILFGGDVASIFHVEKFKNTYPQCSLRNIYGPTECTTFSLSYLVPSDFDKTISLPLGTPISNTSVVILSDDKQVTPVGVPGQICLGGQGLARGYLNQPDLTREKFIDNFIEELMCERLYLTGDIGCYRPDGQIAFLGRIDEQIKLRGYRIELSEIAQALRQLESVVDAVVVIQKPEEFLVAYIIPNPNITILTSTIRQELAHRLPSYMLPDAIEVLTTYPLTSNGKIDKANLPRHQINHRVTTSSNITDNPIAIIIRQIWEEVLNDGDVSCEENFFEIGGNSLKIIHILDRLQEHFKDDPATLAKLDITTLFQYPTILSLANYLNNDNQVSESLDNIGRLRINQKNKRQQASQ